MTNENTAHISKYSVGAQEEVRPVVDNFWLDKKKKPKKWWFKKCRTYIVVWPTANYLSLGLSLYLYNEDNNKKPYKIIVNITVINEYNNAKKFLVNHLMNTRQTVYN